MPAKEVIKHYIDCINDEGRNLTEWELGFMEDNTDRFESGGNLSEKVQGIIERIYVEKVP
jgi:hypothetical protein